MWDPLGVVPRLVRANVLPVVLFAFVLLLWLISGSVVKVRWAKERLGMCVDRRPFRCLMRCWCHVIVATVRQVVMRRILKTLTCGLCGSARMRSDVTEHDEVPNPPFTGCALPAAGRGRVRIAAVT